MDVVAERHWRKDERLLLNGHSLLSFRVLTENVFIFGSFYIGNAVAFNILTGPCHPLLCYGNGSTLSKSTA